MSEIYAEEASMATIRYLKGYLACLKLSRCLMLYPNRCRKTLTEHSSISWCNTATDLSWRSKFLENPGFWHVENAKQISRVVFHCSEFILLHSFGYTEAILELPLRFRASLGVHVSPFVRAEVEIWPKSAQYWALQDGFGQRFVLEMVISHCYRLRVCFRSSG